MKPSAQGKRSKNLELILHLAEWKVTIRDNRGQRWKVKFSPCCHWFVWWAALCSAAAGYANASRFDQSEPSRSASAPPIGRCGRSCGQAAEVAPPRHSVCCPIGYGPSPLTHGRKRGMSLSISQNRCLPHTPSLIHVLRLGCTKVLSRKCLRCYLSAQNFEPQLCSLLFLLYNWI